MRALVLRDNGEIEVLIWFGWGCFLHIVHAADACISLVRTFVLRGNGEFEGLDWSGWVDSYIMHIIHPADACISFKRTLAFGHPIYIIHKVVTKCIYEMFIILMNHIERN